MTELDTAPVRTQQPADEGAEREVLGALIRTGARILDEIVETTGITGAHFHRPIHQRIWDTITGLADRDAPVSYVTLTAEFSRAGDAAAVGNGAYFHTLDEACVTHVNAAYYAKQIVEKSKRRELIAIGTRLQQLAHADGDTTDIIAGAQKALDELAEQGIQAPDYEPLRDRWEPLMARIEDNQRGKTMGVPFGFKQLDALTMGLKPGQVCVLAARPAMGKTTLALDIARAASTAGIPVGMFELEMDRDEVEEKILAAMAGVPLSAIQGKHGGLSQYQRDLIQDARRTWDTSPILIDGNPLVTLAVLKARARRMVKRDGVRLIIVDQLSLMTPDARRQDSGEKQLADLSRGIKLLAKELKVPFLVLHQLNRENEKRTDKRPVPSDLRGSGQIEADADLVMLLHREDMYDETTRPGEADVHVAKHRGGQCGTVTVDFNGAYSRFQDPPT